jgi:hypothetical protein
LLANITRSPLIARGQRPGTYRLDPHAPQRIHALLMETRRRLRAAAARRDPGPPRAARLRALVDRLQRLEDEIADCRSLAAERRLPQSGRRTPPAMTASTTDLPARASARDNGRHVRPPAPPTAGLDHS